MKNVLKIDFQKKELVMDRTFAKMCENTRSEEYTQLQRVRSDYPNYRVVIRSIKKNPNKKTYKGLTYEYMEDYISTHEPEETVAEVLEELEEMRLISACHSEAFRYPVIKKWFLNKYPEIANFGKISYSKVIEQPREVINNVNQEVCANAS